MANNLKNVLLSIDEITLLANAINEALELVEEWEFETRVGYSRSEAIALHKKLSEML